jgi:hypothetical protein
MTKRNPLLGNNGRVFEANAVRMRMARELQSTVEWRKGARPTLAECLAFIDEHGISLMHQYAANKASERQKSFRIVQRNPVRDPRSHGLVSDPPANAVEGDTCVMASRYHPGTYEVLVLGGDIMPGKGYVEMWFLGRQKLTKEHAMETAAAFAS